jgi:RHS repeat-associated protein
VRGGTGAAERLSYDAHGKRRLPNWQPSETLIVPLETPRGFTGHEHLDKLGLIHMNGRVYDPVLGRFLSADPNVQFPETTQGFNRYPYAANNPLSFVDPSGFFIGKLFKAIGKLVRGLAKLVIKLLPAIIAAAACGPAAAACSATTMALVAAGVTGLMTIAHGGSLTDALASGALAFGTAMAFNGVGSFFKPLPATAAVGLKAAQFAAKTLAHGIVGGVSSALRGGKLAAGFLGGIFAAAGAPVISAMMPGNAVGQTVAAAVAGGVGAELGGGKFKNGAITGAFSRLFNHELEDWGDPHGEPFVEDNRLNPSSRRVLAGNRTLDPETGQITLEFPEDWEAVPAPRGGGILIVPPEWKLEDGNVNIMRIQPPGTGSVKYNPDGYYVVYNEGKQPISPYSGKTVTQDKWHNHLSRVRPGQWRK